ncbi:MAG: peptidyl-prolyl cis-trans isomerase [Bacteroidota bacterium]
MFRGSFSHYLLLYLFLIFFASCDAIDAIRVKQETEEQKDKVPVARVFDTYLYEEDLSGLIPEKISGEDSTDRIQIYVKNWIRKQLMITEAAEKVNFDEAEIERKVLDYRYALMIYEYEKYFVNQNLNDSISYASIEKYYNENIENFELKQNIIKGLFVKVPNDAPRIKRLRRWMKSGTSGDNEDLRAYCYSFANNYSLEDTVWVNFDDLVKTSPIAGIPDRINFLKRTKYYETTDSTHLYFLRVEDYKISDDISPLEFERDNVANILINKRKIELAKRLEEEVYDKAKKNNEFEIF